MKQNQKQIALDIADGTIGEPEDYAEKCQHGQTVGNCSVPDCPFVDPQVWVEINHTQTNAHAGNA